MMNEGMGKDNYSEMDGKHEMITAENRPSFLKPIGFIQPGELMIPPQFLKHISKELCGRATLQVSSGSSWIVEVLETNRGVFLQKGWQEFLKDNSVGNNEILHFRYDGDMCFYVKIFDRSGCERVDESSSRVDQESGHHNLKRPRGRGRRPRKYPVDAMNLPPSSSCGDDPGQESKGSNRKKEEKANHRETETEDSQFAIQGVESQHLKPKDKDAPERMTETVIMDSTTQEIDSGVISTESDRNVTGDDRAVKPFPCETLCFKSVMKRSNVETAFVLYIPTSFAKANLPSTESQITLRNMEGATWLVKHIVARKGHYFCGGWFGFVRDNELKVGEVCIFELVDTNTMEVLILPPNARH
ncbi:B3 domain-containing protein Os01g0723500-like isoform X2 [Tripterygium wilfordii]|nr:B3 domain-containing protein Os01g0723500-like isoform X2 [Tripterygium wilfordii]XP_038706129.1 B3 domain-containing protein Os01g0723500-like isoform X2 [Tripterygium wilfordii]